LKAKITSSSALLKALLQELINHFFSEAVNIAHSQLLNFLKESVYFHYFCLVIEKRILTVGSSSSNEVCIANKDIAPFHAVFLQDSYGTIFLSQAAPTALILLNGEPIKGVSILTATDQIQLGASTFAWQSYFDLSIEVGERDLEESNNSSSTSLESIPLDVQSTITSANTQKRPTEKNKPSFAAVKNSKLSGQNLIKGLNLQLVLIYAAVLILLILMAFYV
jgi:hypothetical protein